MGKNNKRSENTGGQTDHKGGAAAAGQLGVGYTQRASDYAATLSNPWAVTGVRVPMSPSIPSATLSVKAYGQAVTGSAGYVGFILCDVRRAIANDLNCAYFTTSAYPESSATTLYSISGTGITAAASNSPYNNGAGDFQPDGLQFRVVSAGVRVFSQIPELNVGGTVSGLCNPAAGNLEGLLYTEQLSMPGVTRERLGSSTFNLTWCPCDPDDFNYHDVVGAMRCMGFYFEAPSTTVANSIDFEFVVNYEIVGRKVPGALRTSPDVVAIDSIMSAKSGSGMGHSVGMAKSAKDLLANAAHFIADQSGHVLGSTAQTLLKYAITYIHPRSPADRARGRRLITEEREYEAFPGTASHDEGELRRRR